MDSMDSKTSPSTPHVAELSEKLIAFPTSGVIFVIQILPPIFILATFLSAFERTCLHQQCIEFMFCLNSEPIEAVSSAASLLRNAYVCLLLKCSPIATPTRFDAFRIQTRRLHKIVIGPPVKGSGLKRFLETSLTRKEVFNYLWSSLC